MAHIVDPVEFFFLIQDNSISIDFCNIKEVLSNVVLVGASVKEKV